jgi:hypothetical protein
MVGKVSGFSVCVGGEETSQVVVDWARLFGVLDMFLLVLTKLDVCCNLDSILGTTSVVPLSYLGARRSASVHTLVEPPIGFSRVASA